MIDRICEICGAIIEIDKNTKNIKIQTSLDNPLCSKCARWIEEVK